MHSLRLSVAGTVIVGLLSGPGGAVVAQETEAPSFDQPYEVTGHIHNPTDWRLWGATWDEARQVEESKLYIEQRIEVDDPRLGPERVPTQAERPIRPQSRLAITRRRIRAPGSARRRVSHST